MKNFQNCFDVFPRMVPADRECEIQIRPRHGHAELPAAEDIEVVCWPVSGLAEGGVVYDGWGCQPPPETGKAAVRSHEARDGVLYVRAFFAGEQEHNLTVNLKNLPARRQASPWIPKDINGVRFNLYSLAPDLARLRPYKGDFHIHSLFSDGKELPEYVAAGFRANGFDFIAITDHFEYHPSLRAMDRWKDLKNGFRLFPGEEVHVPGGQAHIINFGGSFSVNELARENPERFQKEVAEIESALPPGLLPKGANAFPVAASEWAFERIHQGGGLAMFCHPYWRTNKYELSEAVTDAIFRRRKFDVFEVIGGYGEVDWRSQNQQVLRYYEERARGNDFPVAGASDAHGIDGGEYAYRYYTVALSESDELPALIDAMKSGRCAAVDEMGGKTPRVYGEFRLARYIAFLVENYFPGQAELCRTEGALMREALSGRHGARAALDLLGDRVGEYRARSFA